MTRARWRALVLFAAVLVGAAALALAARDGAPRPPAPRPASEQPTLLLLTSLPIVFGEGFSLEGSGSPALKALEQRYRVVPISVTSAAELSRGRLLLLAHPLAQTANNLVALDSWVRDGGRLLLLADPFLEWHSDQPLGGNLRPPTMFMDTGLLGHWGLRLDAPEQRGPAIRTFAARQVGTISPGSLHGMCDINADRLVAKCAPGRGKATVIADADLLNVDELGSAGDHNLGAVLDELEALERQ